MKKTSYFLGNKQETVIFVAQEIFGMYQIIRLNTRTRQMKPLCRREFHTRKRAQNRLDEIADVLGWEIAKHECEQSK